MYRVFGLTGSSSGILSILSTQPESCACLVSAANRMDRLAVALLPVQILLYELYSKSLGLFLHFGLELERRWPLLGAGEACDYS